MVTVTSIASTTTALFRTKSPEWAKRRFISQDKSIETLAKMASLRVNPQPYVVLCGLVSPTVSETL